MIQASRRKFSKRWIDEICSCFSSDWERRTILMTRQGILQLDSNKVTDFLPFDSYFQIYNGVQHASHQFGIVLVSTHRKMVLKCDNAIDYTFFLYHLHQTFQKYNINHMTHGASSFVRQINNLQYISNTKIYFQKVAKAIQSAKQQVFITGWWVSPELPLVRPYNSSTAKYRLDNLLQCVAKNGVHVYVIVFANPPVIPNDSSYTQSALKSLHKNIKVLTHPSNIIPGVWTHHEKIVVIDQKLAFLGGIDLCYGRYDDHEHTVSSNSREMYPGIQYNNNRIADFKDVHKFEVDGIPRNQPRMPWQDIAQVVDGRIVVDISRHFVQYWNNSYFEQFVIEDSNVKSQIKVITDKQQQPSKQPFNPHSKIHKILKNEKIVQNSAKKSKERQQFNMIKEKLERSKDAQIYQMDKNTLIISIQSLGIIRIKQSEWQKLKKEHPDQCQLLRSASQWSIGLEHGLLQASIQNAYLHYIENAQHFIYIENQFFISATGEQDSFVSNTIASALYNRIKKAIDRNEKFKVIVFMPLLPGMAGDMNNNPPFALQLVLYWQYKTISQGQHSLFGRLKKITSKPEDYLQFYALRQHGVLQGRPVTEMLYIHSKLMIVDDKIGICGSANINDRSQEGYRDSQLCIVMSNGEKIRSKMGGQQYEVIKKVHDLRVQLYQKHFDFQPKQCHDPLDDSLTQNMRLRAKVNTQTYRQLWGCYPDDNIKLLKQGKSFAKQPTLEQYNQYSANIVGHTVQFPLHYLQDDDLGLDISLINDIMI